MNACTIKSKKKYKIIKAPDKNLENGLYKKVFQKLEVFDLIGELVC